MIKNKTRNKILTKKSRICRTPFSKAIGFMFRKRIRSGIVMVFSRPIKINLHMLFVFTSIDVLLLDEKKKIIEMKESFKPFTFFNSKMKAKYVIELPNRTVKRTKTKKGDRITF